MLGVKRSNANSTEFVGKIGLVNEEDLPANTQELGRLHESGGKVFFANIKTTGIAVTGLYWVKKD